MAFKLDIQGYLIYGAMLSYLVAFAALSLKAKKGGALSFAAGFVFALGAVLYRWRHAGHVPLQSMFEVFLLLGMLPLPIAVVCKRFLGVGGMAVDALVGLIILVPAGFVFREEPQKLPPALQSWLFIPHVAAYMLAYVIMFKAGVEAFSHFFRKAEGSPLTHEEAAYRIVRFGFPLLTLGLVLGACWGKLAWGNYWNWDPKELWSLVTWLVYLGYFHFRYTFGTRYARANALLVICGLLAIVLTLLWVNLAPRVFSGLHSYS